MRPCQALIQQGVRKGTICSNETDQPYCLKHTRQLLIDRAEREKIRYCDIARGCYTVLEDHESSCKHCLHQARIRDRKRNDQKRQDATLCLDCGTTLTNATRAKGKHDKLLRRCSPCYTKLQTYERNRPPRERNYKAEAFTNKHILWNHYVKSAKKRSIDFAISKTRFNELIVQSCFYCDYKQEGEVIGIDRVDNNKGYMEENVVSCCEPCNHMKGTQHPQEFIDKLCAIQTYVTTHLPIRSDLVDTWATTYRTNHAPTYKAYTKSANSRNIEFTLTEDEFSTIVKQSCYLCGITTTDTNHNGIDRFDNSKGYHLDNCRPCCGHCNLLKKTFAYEAVLDKAAHIARNYETLTDANRRRDIPIRTSKTEPRIKVDTPISQDIVPLEYKPLNEIIVPKEEVSSDISLLLEKKESLPKQWKSKQIHECIQTNQEDTYKAFCEEHNTVLPSWEDDWASLLRSVKGIPFAESEPVIRTFVEQLRRIRHNQLCAKRKNLNNIPSNSIVNE